MTTIHFTDDEYRLLFIGLRTFAMTDVATDQDRAKIDAMLEKIMDKAATQAIFDKVKLN